MCFTALNPDSCGMGAGVVRLTALFLRQFLSGWGPLTPVGVRSHWFWLQSVRAGRSPLMLVRIRSRQSGSVHVG